MCPWYAAPPPTCIRQLHDCSFRLRKATKSCGGQQHVLQDAYTHGVARRLCGLHRSSQGKVQHDIINPQTDHAKQAQSPDGTYSRPPEPGGSGRDKRHPPVARAAAGAATTDSCSSRRAEGGSRRRRRPVVAAVAGGGGRGLRQQRWWPKAEAAARKSGGGMGRERRR